MPYPGGVNPTPGSQGFGSAFDELTAVSSHEVAEAVTDPNVNYKNLGWYDDNLNGEIGDLTNDTVVFSNYVVQKMVDKNDRPIGPVVVTTTLTAPQNVTLRATSSTSATLAWNPVSAAQGYRIFQVNGSQSVLLGTVNSQTTSVQINGLAPGSNVSFKVEAYSGTAIADSQAVSVTMPTGRLIAPVVTARILTASSVQLNWNAVAGTEGYRIYWSDGVHRNLLGTFGPGVTSIRISGLSVGATYKFQIEANRGADVADSSWISVNPSRNQVFHALVSNDSVSGIVGTPTTNRRSRRSLND